MKNHISKNLDDAVIYIAFSRHEFDLEEIKKKPSYIFQWLGSILIRIFTLSKYSHVDYVSNLKDRNDNNSILGAIPDGGLKYRSQHHNNFHALYKCNIYSEDINVKNRFLEYIESQIGSKYDYNAFIGFILPKRDWNKPSKWFCSEIIAAGFKQIGVDFDEQSSRVSPDDLYHTLQASNLLTRIKIEND